MYNCIHIYREYTYVCKYNETDTIASLNSMDKSGTGSYMDFIQTQFIYLKERPLRSLVSLIQALQSLLPSLLIPQLSLLLQSFTGIIAKIVGKYTGRNHTVYAIRSIPSIKTRE